MPSKSFRKGSWKVVEIEMKILQLKYSGSLPAFVGCQKDSGSAVENGTQVKPVLLAVKIFAVQYWISFKAFHSKSKHGLT